jgi:hypothetical protein
MENDERRKLPEPILAEGEVTGHAHRLPRGVDVYERPDGLREFVGGGTLTHEEHGPVEIPIGEWVSGRVREYDHFAEEARQVQD